jgi:Ca-activated chloride channel family protein
MENVADSIGYLLIKVIPNSGVDLGSLPLNIGILIDVSASMRGKKIKCAKESAKRAIRSLRPEDWVSVTAFSDDIQVIVPSSQVGDTAAMEAAIDKMRIKTGTRMSLGLEACLREMRRVRVQNSINRLLILTDGETENEDGCFTIAEKQAEKQFVISAFGIGGKYNEEFLRQLSDETLGGCYHIRDPQQMSDNFQQEIVDVSTNVITNVVLTMQLPDDVSIDSFDRIFPGSVQLHPELMDDGSLYSLDIGNIRKDVTTCFGVKLKLPARIASRVRIAKITLKYSIPGLGIKDDTITDSAIVNYTNNPTLCSVVDREVITYFNQLNAQSLIEQAVRETRVGNIPGATQSLIRVQALTEKIGNINLTRNLEETIQELIQKGSISSDGIKTIRAGSRHTVKVDEL